MSSDQSSTHGFVAPSNGLAGGYRGGNETILRAMTAFTAIAWYNAIEIIFLTFLRFKKYEGLYFYSLLVTSVAIIVYQLGSWGNMLQLYEPTLLFVIFQNIGWYASVKSHKVHFMSGPDLLWQDIHGSWSIISPVLSIAHHHPEPKDASFRPMHDCHQLDTHVHSNDGAQLPRNRSHEGDVRQWVQHHGTSTSLAFPQRTPNHQHH
jgi:hypothetical protein